MECMYCGMPAKTNHVCDECQKIAVMIDKSDLCPLGGDVFQKLMGNSDNYIEYPEEEEK